MTSTLDDARGDAILAAELRGSTAEFLGWLTGLVPPSEKENIPPEMRPAFEKMVGRLVDASKRYAALRAAPVPQCDAEIVERCAKIADPWPGFNVGQEISEPDLSVIEVRTKIAAAIRALALSSAEGKTP